VLNLLLSLYLLGKIDLRYADETAFSLQSNLPYGWSKQCKQAGIPSQKGSNLNVFGLLNLQGDLTSYQTTRKVNSDQIIEWLNDFASTIEIPTVVVLDNAPWHTSNAVEEMIMEWEEKELFIFRLPIYSPHLNKAETLWRKMKYEWLKPEAFSSKENLHQAINNILTNYNNEEFNINFSIRI